MTRINNRLEVAGHSRLQVAERFPLPQDEPQILERATLVEVTGLGATLVQPGVLVSYPQFGSGCWSRHGIGPDQPRKKVDGYSASRNTNSVCLPGYISVLKDRAAFVEIVVDETSRAE
jgi:hypothetical protein